MTPRMTTLLRKALCRSKTLQGESECIPPKSKFKYDGTKNEAEESSGGKRQMDTMEISLESVTFAPTSKRLKKTNSFPTSAVKDIDDLPNEVLGVILQTLDPRSFLISRQVCHRWRSVANYVATFSTTGSGPLEEHETKIRTLYDYIYHVRKVKEFSGSLGTPFPNGGVHLKGYRLGSPARLAFERSFSDHHSRFFSACGKFITKLIITELYVNKVDVLNVLSCVPSLKILCLDCNWCLPSTDPSSISRNKGYEQCEQELWEKAKINLKHLEKLHVTVQTEFSIQNAEPFFYINILGKEDMILLRINFVFFFLEILKNCSSSLKSLMIQGVDIIRTAAFKIINSNEIDEDTTKFAENFSKFRKMETLALKISSHAQYLKIIPSCLQQLKKLKIHFYSPDATIPLTQEHLLVLSRCGSTLSVLHLEFSACACQEHFRREVFQNFRLKLPNLKELRLDSFDGHLDFIEGFSETLEELTLRTQNEEIQTLFRRRDVFFSKLPKLVKLQIDWTSYIIRFFRPDAPVLRD